MSKTQILLTWTELRRLFYIKGIGPQSYKYDSLAEQSWSTHKLFKHKTNTILVNLGWLLSNH